MVSDDNCGGSLQSLLTYVVYSPGCHRFRISAGYFGGHSSFEYATGDVEPVGYTVVATKNIVVQPTLYPTNAPVARPSDQPTLEPSHAPISEPTYVPTLAPSAAPVHRATLAPSAEATFHVTDAPVAHPTEVPTMVKLILQHPMYGLW